MTREEAQKILTMWMVSSRGADGQRGYIEGWFDKDDVEAFRMAIEALSADRPTKWIPVSEKVPEEDEKTYWICTDGGYQCECRWTNVNHLWTDLTTDWHWHICDVPQYDKVVAWMPLPEPYKENEHE